MKFSTPDRPGGRPSARSITAGGAGTPRTQIIQTGLNTPWALRAFLDSGRSWGACDVVRHPASGRLILQAGPLDPRHAYTDDNLEPGLDDLLAVVAIRDRRIRLHLGDGTPAMVQPVLRVPPSPAPGRVAFSVDGPWVSRSAMRELGLAHPESTRQIPIDFLAPEIRTNPSAAAATLDELMSWGFDRFSMSARTLAHPDVRSAMVHWPYELDVRGRTIPGNGAVMMTPTVRSITLEPPTRWSRAA